MSRVALVTGATGLLGSQVLDAFVSAQWKAVGTGYSRAKPPHILKADLANHDDVLALVEDVKPDVVVHCAANRFPDKVDQDPEGARRINVEATKYLVEACKKHSSLLIYISTDYVFPGKPGEAPYEAENEPQPTNLYGQTKRDGELVVLEATSDTRQGIVLRVPVLYGKANQPSESAINVLLEAVWKAQETKVEMDDWSQRYPTATEDSARVCVDVAAKYFDEKEKGKPLPNVLQFSSEDRYTKYAITELFAGILGLPINGIVAVQPSPDASVQRPYDTHLSTKALQDLGISVRTQDFESWWRREIGAYKK